MRDFIRRKTITLDGAVFVISCLTQKALEEFSGFRLFSGRRIEIQPPTVEVDRIGEVLFICGIRGRCTSPIGSWH
jgi:hypothetical protein